MKRPAACAKMDHKHDPWPQHIAEWRYSLAVSTKFKLSLTRICKHDIVRSALWLFYCADANNNCRRVWLLAATWGTSRSVSACVPKTFPTAIALLLSTSQLPFNTSNNFSKWGAILFAFDKRVNPTLSSCTDARALPKCFNAFWCWPTILCPRTAVEMTPQR